MAQTFRISDFQITPDLNRIQGPDDTAAPVQVEPKIMDVLVRLNQARGNVVSREQILADVWGDTVVGDDVLTRAVGHLRKIFGDDQKSPRYIETIPRRGYRLLANGGEPAVSSAKTIQLDSNALRLFVVLLILGGVIAAYLQQRSAVANRVILPTRVFPVTSFVGQEVDPTVSPDGTKVAFSARMGEDSAYNIHVQDLEAGETRQLTFDSEYARHPVWSPDGERLAYVSEGEAHEIFIIPAQGGIPEFVANAGHADEHDLAWSGDGSSLILPVQESPGAPAGLHLLDIATGELQPLTSPDADHRGDFQPAVSPDGRLVAFSRARASGAEDIYTVPATGGEATRLTKDGHSITGLDWSEDGRHVVYSSHRAGVYALWQVSLDGGLPQLVLGGGDKIKDPATARNVGMVAFENWLYETNIWRLPLPGNEDSRREAIVQSTQWDLQPAYSPDGRSMAFVSNRGGTSDLWLADHDGAQPRRLTDLGEGRAGSPCWSPDGTRIAFTVLERGQTDLFVQPVDGGSAFRVTEHPQDELAPAWSSDGHSLYFASRRSGEWQVWEISLESGSLRQLTRDGGFAARPSADGTCLYFTRADASGLWEIDAGGGPPRQLVAGLSPQDWGNWAVAESGIFFVDRTGGGDPVIARFDRESGDTRTFASADSLVGQGLAMSPDGRWLAYSRVDRAECDILAAEGLH